MRKNFAEILKSAKIDIKKEYEKLYEMLYDQDLDNGYGPKTSLYDEYNENFIHMWFRGTSLSLEDFDDEYGFDFDKYPPNFDIEYLIRFCEYFYNLSTAYMGVPNLLDRYNVTLITQQIYRVIEKIGYMPAEQDGFTIFVEKSIPAIAVSEIVPNELSYKVISYNHHSMKGNLENKKETLLKLANLLEGKRKQLKSINSSLEDDLFYAFNNLNLRHNNKDISYKEKYKKHIADVSNTELENWYDEIYQMCLLAFLEIEQIARKKSFNELKRRIEENT
jgi:hypothetical protein